MNEKTKLATMVGRTARYLEDGLSVSEIAVKLNVPENNVREYIEVIEMANENKQ